jgi:uncharacterized protein YjiK
MEVPHCKFNFDSFKSLNKIPEPSDIVYDKESSHFYIVSDHGKLFETDLTGKIIRKAPKEGLDFTGVEVKDSFIYVSDETARKIYKYRKSDLAFVKDYEVSWGGAFNRAFKSIAYNDTKKCFVLVSRDPVTIVEYDDKFHQIEKYPFHGVQDMSGARWYKDNLYLLSNKDDCIIKCDPATYEAKEYYNISVLNPEGLAFDAEDNLRITSDGLQRLYFFKNLPTINIQ